MIGIIVYSKDRAQDIAATLDSIFSQNYKDIVVVVVDDQSTDGSQDIINEVIKNSSILSVEHEYESGVPASIIDGLNLIWDKIDFFCLVPVGAVLDAQKITKSIKNIENYPDYVSIIYSDYTLKIPNSQAPLEVYQGSFDYTNVSDVDPATLISKNSVEKCGSINLDNEAPMRDFYKRITRNYIAVHIPEFLVHYS